MGRGKGPPTGGRGGFRSSCPVSSLGSEGSSGEEERVSFDGGVPGEKRNGVRANGSLTLTGGGLNSSRWGKSLGVWPRKVCW
jgi:hypothetical protein